MPAARRQDGPLTAQVVDAGDRLDVLIMVNDQQADG
jgi:hypothetical protein